MTKSRMRPEARPLKLEVLDYYQKEAIDRISAVLLEALEVLEDRDCSHKAPKGDLDAHRASRLFFLSGEAGGGKTTVYLSLREALAPCAKVPTEKDLQNDGKKLEMFEKLWPKREKLIWLEPLDLEYAPGAHTHNFLAATLVRIEQALLGKEGGAQGKDRRRGVLEAGSAEALQDFEKLRDDVVLAWEGNLRERAEHIDPEVYSMEVIRSATASLDINARLRKALEGTMRENEKYRESLFILPVEDFYLNPSSSLELLRLLRMISVPRLFVLILGDYYTIEELFYQNMLGKLVRQAGEHAFVRIERQKQMLTSIATELTAHSLRKLIPAAQRYRLEVMHQLGALMFHPSRLDPALCEEQTKGKIETLEWFLKQLPVRLEGVGTAPRTLLEFIQLRETSEEKKDDEYYTYSGLAILDLPPREVVDLWCSIMNVLPKRVDSKDPIDCWEGDKGWETTLNIVIDAAVLAISGQSYVSKEAQDLCSTFAIRGNRGYEKSLDTSYLAASPDLAPWLRAPLGDGQILALSKHKGWRIAPSGNPRENMAPRPTAWLTVLHDLMALSGEDLLIGEPLTPGPFDFSLVRVTQGDRQRVWPTPHWISFRHFDRLSFAWRKVVQEAKKRKKSTETEVLLDWLAFHWLRYISDILLPNGNEDALKAQPKDEVAEEDWKRLGDDLRELWNPKRSAEDRSLSEEWLIRLDILLSPEFAVPDSVRNRLSPALGSLWESRAQEIKAIQKKLDETPAP